jgi:thiol-disulfide isomerase/thioredoxin
MYKNLTNTQIVLIVVIILIVLYLLFNWSDNSYEGLTNVSAPNSTLYAGNSMGANRATCGGWKNKRAQLQAKSNASAQALANAQAQSQANAQAVANFNAQAAMNGQDINSANQSAMNQATGNATATSTPTGSARFPRATAAWNRYQSSDHPVATGAGAWASRRNSDAGMPMPAGMTAQTVQQAQPAQPAQPMAQPQERFRLYNFYTNWCGYSKSFMPVWKQIESYYNNSPVAVYTLDADDASNKALANKWNISGYPTVVLETPTQTIQYSGARDLQSITSFVNQQIAGQ